MREFPKISVLKDAILKEHSEKDLNNALLQLREEWADNPRSLENIDILRNKKDLTNVHDEHIRGILIIICKMLKVKIPYVYIHYPDRRTPEQLKRYKKDIEDRNNARPPKIDYEEEIKKIQEKYQMKIQQWREGEIRCDSYNSLKGKEFWEIIDLYLARIREPYKPIDEDGGRPPYVVCSLRELGRVFIYIPRLPDEVRDDFDKFLAGFSKQYKSGESLDYQKIAGEILNYHKSIIDGYEIIVG